MFAAGFSFWSAERLKGLGLKKKQRFFFSKNRLKLEQKVSIIFVGVKNQFLPSDQIPTVKLKTVIRTPPMMILYWAIESMEIPEILFPTLMKANLSSHIRHVHLGEAKHSRVKSIPCPHCNKMFSRKVSHQVTKRFSSDSYFHYQMDGISVFMD